VWKTLLIFDTSYSVMSSYDLADVVEPARSFAHRIVDRDTRAQRVAVAAFDGAEKLRRVVSVPGTDGDEIYFTANANKLDCDLDAFLEPECTLHEDCLTTERPQCVGGLCIDPSTNLYGSVIAGMSRLEREIDEELRLGIPLGGSLVVFTDGSDQAGRASFSDVTEALDESHVSVFAVGVAGEVETEVLEAIGRDGTVYIGGLDELDAAMDEIWGLVDQIGDGIYLVSYCTPARSGSHDITVGLEASGDSLTFEFAASDEALCDPGLAATACESMTCGEGENLIYCGDCAGDEVCQDGACVLACDEGVCGYYRESELGEEIDCGCCASPLSCVDHLCE